MTGPRLLVMDAYAPEGRAALRAAGGTEAGRLYERMLQALEPKAEIEIRYPADPDPDLPGPREILDFDGIAWTGSSLTIHHHDDPRVACQVEFVRSTYAAGVPSFGSCWAAQLATVAAGGHCAPCPRGREFGVARRISLSDAGRTHPLYTSKPATFDAFTSHRDEVVAIADGATVLASNSWSRVQAVHIDHAAGRFWAVQYHPEYDAHEVASLCRLRGDELIAEGNFANSNALADHIESLESLHVDPTRGDLADALGIGRDLLDADVRTREVRNWLDSLSGRDPS